MSSAQHRTRVSCCPVRTRMRAAAIVAVATATLSFAAAPPRVASAQVAASSTLGEILDSLHRGAELVHLATVQPQASAILDSLTRVFDDARARGFTIGELTAVMTGHEPGWRGVAHWDAEVYRVLAQPGFRQALIGLQQIAITVLRPLLSSQMTPEQVRAMLAPVSALGTAVLQNAQAGNQERLRRYYIKYGSDAPRLNVVEVGLNYVAQRWIPGFGTDGDGSPSPFELVASYRTTELTAARDSSSTVTGRVVSAAQLGIRKYSFDPNWGTGGVFSRFIRPSHAAAGFYVAAPRDLPLQRVWVNSSRAGMFAGWGGVHLGYVFGQDRRLILGNSMQILPYLF